MPRLTCSDVEQTLMAGEVLSWQEGNQAKTITLSSPVARRLFAFVLASTIREVKGLPNTFIEGLVEAFDGTFDPAQSLSQTTERTSVEGPWYLVKIETDGFGGLNTWKGPTFTHRFDEESLLIDGPNGSGKSSLVAAISWALRGDHPRDTITGSNAHQRTKVFNGAGTAIGDWPALACYPSETTELGEHPEVRVKLTFRNPSGTEAITERLLRNGQIISQIDEQLELPDSLIETGVMMPIRLNSIRFGTSESPLLEAVQMLTGLDEVAMLGDFVADLCHKGREYLKYARTHRRDDLVANFNAAVQRAKDALKPLNRKVPDFQPKDTMDSESPMAKLDADLQKEAANLLQVIKVDLADTIDLSHIDGQRKITVAIDQARRDVASGLSGLTPHIIVTDIKITLTDEVNNELNKKIQVAKAQLKEALTLHENALADPRFRLKALAAAIHTQHSTGPIEICPLCAQSILENMALANELEKLRTAGEAAQQKFSDNANAIAKALEESIPAAILKWREQVGQLSPKADYVEAIQTKFITGEHYRSCLAGIAKTVQSALSEVPANELPPMPTATTDGLPDGTKLILETIAVAERIIDLAAWAQSNSDAWEKWWNNLAGLLQIPADDQMQPQKRTLSVILDKLDEAATASAPYSAAATALGDAFEHGRSVVAIDIEQQRRQEIANALVPLKELRKFTEVEVRNAIEGLSTRMSRMLDDIHIVERFQFESAHLDKKTGVNVRGSFHSGMLIDATLVANTSWIRALLWAFIFALRQEAIEQLGGDRLPLLVLDDPQATFDNTHRFKWAKHVAAMQAAMPRVQVILATHDEAFLEEILIAKVEGQKALMISAGSDNGSIQLLIGGMVERDWREAKRLNTPQAAQSFIANTRIYIEAFLKAILRGEPDTRRCVMGELRERIRQLHEAKISPWNRSHFANLVKALNKERTEIKYLESAHHTTGRNLGIPDATEVERFWRKEIYPSLEKCFRAIREHHLLHGGSKALYADPPSVPAPNGHREIVRTIPLELFGRAAALTEGRVSMTELGPQERKTIVLGHHDAIRLIAPTLEPVARVGDILLVAQEDTIPEGSLVVAACEDRLLARRLQFASDHPDVALLVAQSISPREIAPPFIAHKSSISLNKIIGVLFDPNKFTQAVDEHEVTECYGTDAITKLISGTFGIVEVSGESAEPIALNGQFLLVCDPVESAEACRSLNGRPVIASDSNDHYYFKRLRVIEGGAVVLESLDAGGNYEPVFLDAPGGTGTRLNRVWPVAGVLFELPQQ